MLSPLLQKNDRKARILIFTFSIIVFGVIVALGRIPKPKLNLGFDPHIFAAVNAILNTAVSILLIVALVLVKAKKFTAHRNTIIVAMVLSILFLVSYISHHILAGDTRFGGEGTIRYIYFFILSTHILLAAIILPFILFTAYRGLSGEYVRHKKLARYTWPLWLYVSITGPIVWLMISPYY